MRAGIGGRNYGVPFAMKDGTDRLVRRDAIEALAREIAELFGRTRWDQATELQRKTWIAEATAIYLSVVAGSNLNREIVDPEGWAVHNHGPSEGRGTACREYGLNGRLVGACKLAEALS